jgi:hypothetical protein
MPLNSHEAASSLSSGTLDCCLCYFMPSSLFCVCFVQAEWSRHSKIRVWLMVFLSRKRRYFVLLFVKSIKEKELLNHLKPISINSQTFLEMLSGLGSRLTLLSLASVAFPEIKLKMLNVMQQLKNKQSISSFGF